MTGPIRNSNVARGNLAAAGFNIVYTVPTGNVLLLKHVAIYNTGTVAAHVNIRLSDDVTGATPFLTMDTINNGSFTNWNGWAALNAGQHLVIQTDQGSIWYWADGALLPFI